MLIHPGTTVHLIPDTTPHAIMGATAVVGKVESVPYDDPIYIALVDPRYNKPRICLREHVVELREFAKRVVVPMLCSIGSR